jgi:hypothetical protein
VKEEDKENMKIIEEVLRKVFTGAFLFGRIVSGRYGTQGATTESEVQQARELANAAVKPLKPPKEQ